jgi:hypothetical protein
MDSHPRTGKRCKKSYRYNKTTKMCDSKLRASPIADSYPRVGRRCKTNYRYNKSKKLCISKLNSPSPDSNVSYIPNGRRCRKSFRYHKPSGLCVYRDQPVNRAMPLPMDKQETIIPYEREEMVDEFVSPANSESSVEFYSPESPVAIKPRPNKLNMMKNMGVEL